MHFGLKVSDALALFTLSHSSFHSPVRGSAFPMVVFLSDNSFFSCHSCAFAGDAFFTPRLQKAAVNLRVHVENGCLSDPDPRHLPLYYVVGRTREGLDKIRSTRWTNREESYYTPLRPLMGSCQTSPRLAHVTMMLFNYRRNYRMACTCRSLRRDLAS